MAGISQGPTPWWQLPGMGGKRDNLTASAPAGYQYDPVKMGYTRTPGSLGQDVNTFSSAASPALSGLMSSLKTGGTASGSLSGSASGGNVSGAPGGSSGALAGLTAGSRVAPVAAPDYHAASDAAFATAKDKAGSLARSSVDSLRDELGATGMLGGGAEAQGVRDTVQSGAGLLGQVSRDQAGKEADLGADFAKTTYAGNIAQRGQDVNAQEAQARLAQERELEQSRLAFQQQQAAASQQLSMLQLALGGLKGLTSGSGLAY